MLTTPIYMLLALLTIPLQTGDFDQRETALINSNRQGGIMELFTTHNPDQIEILRRVCTEVDSTVLCSPEYHRLLSGMLATVTDPENTGVGIAAPQVGVNKRIIAVQRFDVDGEFGFYLNPRIIGASLSRVESMEGCLSIPDARGCVMRYEAITIEYNHPEDFSLCREEILGFTAIIFQHEIDHLDGVLFTDKTLNTDGEN